MNQHHGICEHCVHMQLLVGENDMLQLLSKVVAQATYFLWAHIGGDGNLCSSLLP